MKNLPLKDVFLLLAAAILSSACAMGNKYSYNAPNMVLPVRGDASVGLAVIDERPYVLDGDKSPDFVGLQRGGFGNPFDVKTESGKPLSDEMQTALADTLENNGYKVTLLQPASGDAAAIDDAVIKNGLDRNLIILLKEWKTDAMMRFALSYDVILRILDQQTNLLAENEIKGDKEVVGGAGFESANSNAASRAFENKMNQLFSAAEIIRAME